jgi:hypothetical protein
LLRNTFLDPGSVAGKENEVAGKENEVAGKAIVVTEKLIVVTRYITINSHANFPATEPGSRLQAVASHEKILAMRGIA